MFYALSTTSVVLYTCNTYSNEYVLKSFGVYGEGFLDLCCSKYVLWTSSVGMTWKLIRNAGSQAPP